MVRKFLFQLHLWSGLILGIVFVLIGLSGSIVLFQPVFQARPAILQVTAVRTPALDKGLAAARTAVKAPQWTDATITLPGGSDEPVHINFGGQIPGVATDSATGRVLATYTSDVPGWFRAIQAFHSDLWLRDGRILEGWLGLAMALTGLTGLTLWWPRAGQWRYGFIVRRKAKGLRFHRELHGAAGIWTLALYLVVTVTGVAFQFPLQSRAVIIFLTRDRMTPRALTPVVAASAGAVPIGPDAALAAANKASGLPVMRLQMPGWEPGWPNLLAIRASFGEAGIAPVYIDPYHATLIPGPPAARPTKADRLQRMMGPLHTAAGLGPVYTVLVFISGLMPLIFFVTGLILWLKKRQNRLPMSEPLPESIMGRQAP